MENLNEKLIKNQLNPMTFGSGALITTLHRIIGFKDLAKL